MQENRIAAIDKILTIMAIYYDKSLVDTTVDLYHELLADYDPEEISAACKIYMKASGKGVFYPKASEIIQIITDNHGPVLSIESRAQTEWRKVMLAVRQRGLNRGAPEFKDAITKHLIQAQFNWEYLCGFQAKDMNWEQKRWCEAYELASEIDLDQLRIDSAANIKKLIAPIGGKNEKHGLS
jgi:hypothetical protein